MHAELINYACMHVHEVPVPLHESYVKKWLWRKQYGEDPFGNIMKHRSVLRTSLSTHLFYGGFKQNAR